MLILGLALFRQDAAPASSEIAFQGPGVVCFGYSRFSLLEGERITAYQMGLHGVRVSVEGPGGSYQISENEIYRTPNHLGRRVQRDSTQSIYRATSQGETRYAVMARPSFSPDRDVMLLTLSGEAFTGRTNDAAIYSRLTVTDSTGVRCDYGFRYGWDAMFEEVD